MSNEEKKAIDLMDVCMLGTEEAKIIKNLIQKQETEIDRLIEVKCYTESEAIKLLKENIKLNKMIDLMVKYIDSCSFCAGGECIKKCKEHIKEYFRKKVETNE